MSSPPPAPRRSPARRCERIAALYAIENDIRGRSAEERRAVRQDEVASARRRTGALAARKARAHQPEEQARRGDPLRAVALGRPDAASSTTAASRSTPTPSSARSGPIALNRKNALFAGSDGGGENWAIIASLIETCKLCGVDPQAYLADVLTKIVNGHPNSADRRSLALGLRHAGRRLKNVA